MKKKWWKEAVVYQIYPKSFQDSNGDGIGDIRGIINRLDYLENLGVNVLWLCPVFKSPMDDNGYDISDYYHVDPMFGTDEDLDELIEEAGKRGIKLLMDLVINHTSDEHEWFQAALKDKHSKYRDYYVFREGIEDGPPNNWRSYFGGSAWEKVGDDSNTYYLHAFSKKQPDLNWENEEVREELYKMVNYWLEKGLGGFRIDAILNIKKKIESGRFEPDGEDGYVFIGNWILNQPGIGEWLNELNERTFKLHNSMTVAEANVPDYLLPKYIGDGNGYFSMVFDFAHSDIDVPETGEWYKQYNWTVPELRDALFNCQLVTQKAGWGATYFENHDHPRSINKYIPEDYISKTSKKMLGTLFMFLQGTPFVYQGQELGMTNIPMDSIEDYDDIATHDQYNRALLSGFSEEKALEGMFRRSRDNSRTPMQWDASKNGGFSKADTTWLKVNPNYKEINAAEEEDNDQSVLAFYQELISMRRKGKYKETIVYGEFVPDNASEGNVIAYQRQLDDEKILIVVNFDNQLAEVNVSPLFSEVVMNNYEDVKLEKGGRVTLRPYESLVLANF
ncbi:oligo-1,6-glucosidase [Neobacillus bataviensis LMG 21833]|uniref:Oligo-1,6-glucosidase n=1 Tax=Neobacillus bataviensis LMG 21833 TaxID=1117379 RepID=K6DB26_9BACI|nr:alpha-glucosidase [Neobacillus bataviensis]EKN69742.1 oligo-1,6-glucosidase [Neobacillus bataviensis LMG 21833]